MEPLPNHPRDWALWLLEQLQDLSNVGDRWEGALPASFNFQQIVELVPSELAPSSDSKTRRIEFSPQSVGVFENLDEFVTGSARRIVPKEFVIRDIGYIHGVTSPVPARIQWYINAVQLWQLLDKFSDLQRDQALLFIKSHESKIWLAANYSAADLHDLRGVDEFVQQYFNDSHHRDQKRNLIRDSLIEIFKSKGRVDYSELLASFDKFVEKVRSSYALFVQDFSYEKLLSETEKLNLDDTLRLNKVFSDIQNQLLALPAALIAAGASFKLESLSSNLPILLGVLVFSWIMWHLIANQKNSIAAIQNEIELRRNRIDGLPEQVAQKILPLFKDLEKRSRRQTMVLGHVGVAVAAVLGSVLILFVHAQWPDILNSLRLDFGQLLYKINALIG